jgi:hypothetical protein
VKDDIKDPKKDPSISGEEPKISDLESDEAIESRIDQLFDPSQPDILTNRPNTSRFQPTNKSVRVKVETADEPAPESYIPAAVDDDMPSNFVQAIGSADEEHTEKAQSSDIDAGKNKKHEKLKPLPSKKLDDATTDKAVDEIAAEESDKLLAVDDAAAGQAVVKGSKSWKDKLRDLVRKKWFWPVVIGLILMAVFAIPMTRYKLLGLVLKSSYEVVVTDQKTNTPVSGAIVKLADQEAKTDGAGKASLKAAVGNQELVIEKQYYQSYSEDVLVPIKRAKSAHAVSLAATGRQVPLVIKDRVSGQPLAGVEISILDTEAKTDKNGKSTVVLPTKTDKLDVKLSLKGYNDLKTSAKVTSQVVPENTFELTPAGKVYFLSNQTGKIDVVKTNLDGSDRKVVLAGNGQEDPRSTVLLAARDWNYVVLLSKRDSSGFEKLTLIDTKTDKTTTIEDGKNSYNLVGWYGHRFIYSLTRQNLDRYAPNRQALKSYDADSGRATTLDQNQAESNDSESVVQDLDNFYILDNLVVYTTSWTSSNYPGTLLAGKSPAIRGVKPDGSGLKDYKTFDIAKFTYINARLYAPQEVYFAAYNSADAKTEFYELENGSIKSANVTDSDFYRDNYPTYLLSPSGEKTFWTELRDGKNSLFVGDSNGKSGQAVASASQYRPYGWFSDNYLLISKDNSELFILPATPSKDQAEPLKVSNYYKPDVSFAGYGYGYGGL